MKQVIAFLAIFFACGVPAQADVTKAYCSQGRADVLVLVDVTTQLDQASLRIIGGLVDRAVQVAGAGDRLQIRTIEDRYTSSRTVFNGCKPGCRETGLTVACTEAVARNDMTGFQATLITALQPLRDSRDLAASEIIMTIASLAQPRRDGRTLRMFLFSDLIEHSEFVRAPADVGRLNGADYVRALPVAVTRLRQAGYAPNLSGAPVVVRGFGRFHDPARSRLPIGPTLDLRRAWVGFFQSLGATEVDIGFD